MYVYEACNRGLFDVINFHIQNGTDLSNRNKWKVILLEYAFKLNRLDVFDYLIKHGANINDVDSQGRSMLHYGCRGYGSLVIVRHLISKGANPNIVDNYGFTPFLLACKWQNYILIALLLYWDVNLNVRGVNECTTPLRLACDFKFDNLNIIKLLAEKGANINESGLMHIAIKNRRIDIVQYFIDNGVDVNSFDADGNSPLYLAYLQKHFKIMYLLLRNDADMYPFV